MTELLVTSVAFTPGTVHDVAAGLLGYVQLTLASSLRIDGVTLRRTADGRLALSFPARSARDGRRYPVVAPVDDGARRRIEAAVLAALVRRPAGARSAPPAGMGAPVQPDALQPQLAGLNGLAELGEADPPCVQRERRDAPGRGSPMDNASETDL